MNHTLVLYTQFMHAFDNLLSYAHDTVAGDTRWNPSPESDAGLQRAFPARVAAKFALVSSASFHQENNFRIRPQHYNLN